MPDKVIKPNTDPLIGALIDNYEVKSLLGIGGMARVYEAVDEKLGRPVALKVLTSLHDTDEEAAERFLREARTLANLHHARIVTLFHIGEYNHSYYISMRLIEGGTLLTVLKKLTQQKKFMEPERILAILSDVAEALDYAHSKGIVHRDIKPSNIMLGEDGRAILTDFGLTMQSGAPSTQGNAFGTPRYIAPEQAISSNRAVPQSDVYSLGVVLYEILTGQTPFDNDSPMSLALSHITSEPPPPRSLRSDISPAVENVVLTALKKGPAERYQTAGALVAALRAAFDPNTEAATTHKTPSKSRIRKSGLTATPTDRAVRKTNNAPSTLDIAPVAVPLSEPINTAALLSVMGDGGSALPRKRQPRNLAARLIRYGLVTLLILVGGDFAVSQALAAILPRPLVAGAPPLTATPPRLRLIYASNWLAIYNPTGRTVSLHGVTFVHGNGNDGRATFYPARYLTESAMNALGDGQCLLIVLKEASDEPAPYVCGPQTRPGIITDSNARFWLPFGDKAAIFVVKRDQTVVQTCQAALNTCEFTVP